MLVIVVVMIMEAPADFINSAIYSQFTAQAALWSGYGFNYGAYDYRQCDTVLDSVENNRASYFYLAGRTRSRDLVMGRDTTQHTNCYPENVGYVAKFNQGVNNFTKFFHGTSSDKILDVPVLRLSGDYNYGYNIYSDFIAGMVRYQSTNIIFILDGNHGGIEAMWMLETHYVSTHKMFHYRNFEFNWMRSGKSTNLADYGVYVGLTKQFASSYGQPSGSRYYRLRFHSQHANKEIYSED